MMLKRAMVALAILATLAGAIPADGSCETRLTITEVLEVSSQEAWIVVENADQVEHVGVVQIKVEVDGEEITFGLGVMVGAGKAVTVVVTAPIQFTVLDVSICGEWPHGLIESPDPFDTDVFNGKGT